MLRRRTTISVLVVTLATIGPLAGIGGFGGAAVVPTTLPFPRGLSFSTNSLNWAGYAVTGGSGSVTQVTGSWVEPSVSCPRTLTYAAFWDGIDGYNSNTVEQAGTLAYCSGGHAYYYAWYEFYPAASVEISSFTVHPGDKVSVAVTYNATAGSFSITVKDGTSSYTKTGTVSGAERASAECIAERPEVGSRLANLADFGTTEFGSDYTATIGCAATVAGSASAFGGFSTATAINMVDSAGRTLASTSALSSDGTSFTETWVASN
jgi:hypothetical protein